MKIKKEISAGGIVFKIQNVTLNTLPVLWLVTQHSQHKGWVFPKGLIGDTNENEKMEDAFKRELREETALVASSVEFLGVTESFVPSHCLHLNFVVRGVEESEVQTMEKEKCEGWKFYDIDNLPDVFASQMPLIEQYIKSINSLS